MKESRSSDSLWEDTHRTCQTLSSKAWGHTQVCAPRKLIRERVTTLYQSQYTVHMWISVYMDCNNACIDYSSACVDWNSFAWITIHSAYIDYNSTCMDYSGTCMVCNNTCMDYSCACIDYNSIFMHYNRSPYILYQCVYTVLDFLSIWWLSFSRNSDVFRWINSAGWFHPTVISCGLWVQGVG